MNTTKEALLDEIRRLKHELNIEKNRIKKAKYGLVWLDVPEAFEDNTENQLPVLEEVKDSAIINVDGKPTHILIEGDNYHALTCLNYTHKGKIDLIYIDPPYNTGKDGFMYKDKRLITRFPDGNLVPKDHPLRHSYWLSFMFKRLEIARDLLKEEGVIFISIDDNELYQVKLLCDKIFNPTCFVANLVVIMNLKGNQDTYGFTETHEYCLVYTKKESGTIFQYFNLDEDEIISDWQQDEYGYFKKADGLRATGINAPRSKRPNLFYPIFINLKTKDIYTTEEDTPKNKTDIKLLPINDDGEELSWYWSKSKVNKEKHNLIITSARSGGVTIYKKQRPSIGDIPTKKPKSLFYKPSYSTSTATVSLKNMFGKKVFNGVKPVPFIKDIIKIGLGESGIVLDFFAGSGTTLQACLELNHEGANIQNIICTNNEGNICQDVTYPRAVKVINGYKNLKGLQIEPLGNSLKYYKTSFVGNNSILSINDKDKTELAQKAGCLLSIAENTLDEVEHTSHFQFFKSNDRNTAIYFQEDLSELDTFVNKVEKLENPTTVYLFSWGNKSEFESMFDHIPNINIKTIPQPILEIYKKIYYINN